MMVAKVTPSSSGSTYPRLAVRLPCGSASINKTFLPSLARPIPKFTVVVVFPTLCEASHKVGYEKLHIMQSR